MWKRHIFCFQDSVFAEHVLRISYLRQGSGSLDQHLSSAQCSLRWVFFISQGILLIINQFTLIFYFSQTLPHVSLFDDS